MFTEQLESWETLGTRIGQRGHVGPQATKDKAEEEGEMERSRVEEEMEESWL